ncbi:MAG: hypothetical protein IJA36_08185 [Lachnospiraceae bacterium]|nr:hypothetical protein [Lachnospiraceae bacterium]
MKKKQIKYIATIAIGVMISCMVPQQLQAQGLKEVIVANASLKDRETINVGSADLVINSAREMNEFAVKVNNSNDGYQGRVVKLGKDIEYTGIDNYTPIKNFRGTFDGCGHTIKGIQVMGTGDVGLFASTYGAIIQNVTIEDCSFTTSGIDAGGIVGDADSTNIKNCHNVNSTVNAVTSGYYVGGIVGYGYNGSTVLNCSSSGKIVGCRDTGGIAGFITYAYNSYNTGQVENVSTTKCVGGIAGSVSSIMNCYNTGNISGSCVGGIAGSVNTKAVGNYCAEEAADINFYKMSGQEAGNEALSLSQMKTDSFVQKLNANLGTTHDDWLKWQKGNGSSFPQHIPLISMGNTTVTLSTSKFTYNGQKQCPKVKVTLAGEVLVEGLDYEVTYNNCKEPGTATVSVAGLGRYIDSVELEYTILPVDLKTAKVTLSQSSYYYDGYAKTPEVTISVGGVVLGKWSEEDDYEDYSDYDEDQDSYTPWISISFKNNVTPGTATVTITGSGTHYTGTVSKTFKILKQNQSIATAGNYNKTDKDAAFYISAYVNSGDGALSYKSSNTSVVSVNAKTGYATIKGPGRAVITITAKATTAYNEKQVQVIVNVKPKKQSVTVKTGKNRTLSVKWSKDTKVTGYILQYGTDKSFKKNTKEVIFKKNKQVSKKLSKLKKGKTYYVRVRSYKTMKVNGKVVSLNGAWSKKVCSGKIR